MAVYWTIDVTFSDTPAIKLIEHQKGSAYIQLVHTTIMGPLQPAPPPPLSGRLNRQERRQQMHGQSKRYKYI